LWCTFFSQFRAKSKIKQYLLDLVIIGTSINRFAAPPSSFTYQMAIL
jgi:hypothetical protein